MNTFLSDAFNKYLEWNIKLDLTTIIFYLSNAEQATSMGERIFIQTIILERLSEAYAKTFQESTETILPDLDNEKLKSALEKVIDSNRSLFATSEDFHKVKGRILNFNKAKRNKTEDKMLNLINFLKIKITPETEHILKEARHYIIHTGEIGEAAKARDNYLYLDKLIREIILSLIEYKGYVKQIQK